MEVFLSQIEKELVELALSPFNCSNFSSEVWRAIRSLVKDRNVVVKKIAKGFYVVMWDLEDYIAEAERQLRDVTVYKDVDFKEKMLQDIAATSNKLSINHKNKGRTTRKKIEVFYNSF